MDESTDDGHERSDLDARAIALFGAALALAIGVVVAVTLWMVHHRAARDAAGQAPAAPLAHTREATPEPRLQVDGAEALSEMREAEDGVLTSYAWIDRDAGIVRIPIERAMEILAEQETSKQYAEGSKQKTKTKSGRNYEVAQ
jgi:hypothetical protein